MHSKLFPKLHPAPVLPEAASAILKNEAVKSQLLALAAMVRAMHVCSLCT
jgi:hypothetical protein